MGMFCMGCLMVGLCGGGYLWMRIYFINIYEFGWFF